MSFDRTSGQNGWKLASGQLRFATTDGGREGVFSQWPAEVCYN